MFNKPVGGRLLMAALVLAVAALVVACVALVLWLVWPPLARGFLVLTALAIGYAYAVEPYWVDFREAEIGVPDLPEAWEGLRIAHVTDLHLGFCISSGWLARVFGVVADRKPDLVVLTGDLFSGHTTGTPSGAERLGSLQGSLGTFAVLGNHDWFADTGAVLGALDRAGIRLLRNESAALERAGARLWIVGVDDLSTGHDDLEAAGRDVPEGEVRVLLSHSPDLVEEASDLGYPVMLSGHTHGGQVCLPLTGPVFCFSRFYRRYASGLFQVGPTGLYVNRGLGKALLPFRFLCRPEVAFLTLRRC